MWCFANTGQITRHKNAARDILRRRRPSLRMTQAGRRARSTTISSSNFKLGTLALHEFGECGGEIVAHLGAPAELNQRVALIGVQVLPRGLVQPHAGCAGALGDLPGSFEGGSATARCASASVRGSSPQTRSTASLMNSLNASRSVMALDRQMAYR